MMTPKLAVIPAAALLFAGCAMTRTTTTEKTAVEQALMSRSALDSLAGAEIPRGSSSFTLSDTELVSEHKEVLLSATRQSLLEAGYRVAAEDAELTVHARANYSAIDDGRAFIGIPSIPVPIPAVGTVTTPELVLFKREAQRGRNQLELYAVRNEDGSLAFSSKGDAAERGYTRWVVLFVIGWRSTDLGKPF